MVEIQGFKTLTPAAAAELVGVGSHTIRNWCEWHGTHLSAGANPGPGGQRRLSMVDIEVFKTVHNFRLQGLKTETINEKLSGLTFAEIDDSEEIGTVVPKDDQLLPPVNVQERSESTQTAIVPLDYIATIERRFEALERSKKDYVQGLAVGFVGALVFVVLLLLLFLLRHNL